MAMNSQRDFHGNGWLMPTGSRVATNRGRLSSNTKKIRSGDLNECRRLLNSLSSRFMTNGLKRYLFCRIRSPITTSSSSRGNTTGLQGWMEDGIPAALPAPPSKHSTVHGSLSVTSLEKAHAIFCKTLISAHTHTISCNSEPLPTARTSTYCSNNYEFDLCIFCSCGLPKGHVLLRSTAAKAPETE